MIRPLRHVKELSLNPLGPLTKGIPWVAAPCVGGRPAETVGSLGGLAANPCFMRVCGRCVWTAQGAGQKRQSPHSGHVPNALYTLRWLSATGGSVICNAPPTIRGGRCLDSGHGCKQNLRERRLRVAQHGGGKAGASMCPRFITATWSTM